MRVVIRFLDEGGSLDCQPGEVAKFLSGDIYGRDRRLADRLQREIIDEADTSEVAALLGVEVESTS